MARRMRTHLPTVMALGAALLSNACVDSDELEPEAEPGGDTGQITPLMGDRSSLFGVYEVGKTWPKDFLTVCWMPDLYFDQDPDVKALRDAGKAVVMKEWSRVSRVRLSGWQSCSFSPDSPKDIRIGRMPVGGGAGRSEIGTNALDVPADQPTMLLNFSADDLEGCRGNPSGLCRQTGPEGLDPAVVTSFEHVILHEFGHALGLRHEHAHTDETCSWEEDLDPDGYNGQTLWAYDPASVMNYCAQPTKLSVGDIRTLNTLYPGVVNLYTENDLGGTAAPLRLGPGAYTAAQIPTLGQISAIVVPPGFRVLACNGTYCANYTSTARTLSSTYNNRITSLAISADVIGADESGYDGTSERFSPGEKSASQFQTLPDNEMSSMFVPLTRAARVCDSPTGGTPCSSTYVGGGAPVAYRLPTGIINAVSYIDVDARVATFSGLFTGTSYALAPGTYTASGTAPWLVDVSSLALSGLEVRACTEEGSPLGTGGGDCRTYTHSVGLDAAGHGPLRYLKVSLPLENAL
jgi:hypothetical protein